jgi:hypothetical protein
VRKATCLVVRMNVGVREAKGGVWTCRTWFEEQLSKSEEHDMIYAKHMMLHQATSITTHFLRVHRQATKHNCPDSHNNNNQKSFGELGYFVKR